MIAVDARRTRHFLSTRLSCIPSLDQALFFSSARKRCEVKRWEKIRNDEKRDTGRGDVKQRKRFSDASSSLGFAPTARNERGV